MIHLNDFFHFHPQNTRNYIKSKQVFGTLALLGTSKVKMSAENTDLQDLLQNADQLFDNCSTKINIKKLSIF